ncbi:MAG TPA: hypothetical protein DCW90_17880 [Lachnospiraceae bacterium]|nr:hypothetical protein [Lachnospiraceae bacterium]
MTFDEACHFVYERFSEVPESLYLDALYYTDDDVSINKENEIYGYYNEIMQIVGASEYNFGCSKIVFSFDELEDYVVKIPFFGEWVYDEDAEDDCMYGYTGASDEGYCDDYCNKEAEVYKLFKKNSLDDFVFGTKLAGWIYDNVPVYISEKCDVCGFSYFKDGTAIPKALREIGEKTSEKNNWVMSGDVIANFIMNYGEEKTNEFLKFIRNNGIGDLHKGNVGFDANNNIRLIDYSGFNS